MTDTEASPLSDDERAELEALRAEKARREEEERARRERAELEALRAEQQRADAAKTREAERPAQVAPAKATPRPASTQQKPVVDPDHLTFGQKMVLGDASDDEDVPGMPPAQKLIVGLALLFVVVGAAWMFLH